MENNIMVVSGTGICDICGNQGRTSSLYKNLILVETICVVCLLENKGIE